MNRNTTVIVGCKWGDEGKGKIASYQLEDAKLVIRGTGGANAGHSVVYNGKTLPLHLVPGGITYPHITAIIGPGTVIDLQILISEIEMLKDEGIPDIANRLKISGMAHVLCPFRNKWNECNEKLKGIRMYDLLLPEEELKLAIHEALSVDNIWLSSKYSPELCAHLLASIYHSYGEVFKQYITDIQPIISNALLGNEKIVVEGAQAFRLDLDHGDYPMVTSSNCSTAGTLCSCGLPPNCTKEVIGIDKAYNSCVGNGPFPTEEQDFLLDGNGTSPGPATIIRELGHEYGTTTKRPRRCGWMDCPILRSAHFTMGIDYLCINHLDTLGEVGLRIGYIKVCVAYDYCGNRINYFPDDLNLTKQFPIPVYETIRGGWRIDSSCKSFDDLPDSAKKFIEIVEQCSGIPVKYIGTGPANDDLIIRDI
ncbi:MAG: adenylosuccinate synthetase [Clostridia bacterium]|nr:adenylosuccinate synthetase [Clostridia bacterium]